MLLGLETSDNRMMKLARDEIYFGRYVPVKEIVKEIDKVTLAEMKKAASEFLSPDRITMVAMGKVNNRRLPSPLKAMV